jgi:hypothetical protein
MKINLFTSVTALLFGGTAAGVSQSITLSRTLTSEHAPETVVPVYKALDANEDFRVVPIDIRAIKDCKMVQSFDPEDRLAAARQLAGQ